MIELFNNAIIKGVPEYLTDADITSQLVSRYPESKARRFVTREGTKLKTVMITFSSADQFDDAWENDLHIEYQKYRIVEYKPKKRVIQCFRCKGYDHVEKWCYKNYKCNKY